MQEPTATMAAYPTLPASPTLTNPDMILPYEFDSTPSPPRRSLRSATNDNEWRDKSANLPFSIGPPRTQLSPPTPVTPIIYGNGTMLSDIGEVTEAESTHGRKIPGPAERRLLKQAQGLPLRSSPTLGYKGTKRMKSAPAHERKASMESTSTVTDEQQAAEIFKDFDDGVSVDDSNFQGDDEGSVADSYSEELIAMETERLMNIENSIAQDDDPNSSAALSRRAEQILLNAKKRLNNMEGNLTRARSSLDITPSGSMSSIHSSSPLTRSTPSPQSDSKILPQLGKPPAKHRQLHTHVESPNAAAGHSRVYSENSIASNLETTPFNVPPANSKSSPPHNYLAPVKENTVPQYDVGHASGRPNLEEEFLDLDAEGRELLTRPVSSMQMRDLRDQMHDLKGRLSVLRDRARDDTMKRRSLQSLRTPSPFTAAEQWYTSAKDLTSPGLSTDAGIGHSSIEGAKETDNHASDDNLQTVNESAVAQIPEYASSDATSIYEDVSEGHHATDELLKSYEPDNAEGEKHGEAATEANEQEESEDDADNYSAGEPDEYESDATLYHDATSISHEDREDAFDYEHFFLHSAMGTISQQRLGRRDSIGSESSVETTRGPQANGAINHNGNRRVSLGHLRSESTDSVSTMVTFATATEGLGSEVDDSEYQSDYAVQEAVALPVQPVTPVTPVAVKRTTFGPSPASRVLQSATQSPPKEAERPGSENHRLEQWNGKNIQRPSVASFDSFESTGTTRSFPLINKPKAQRSLNSFGILDYGVSSQNGSLNRSATLIENQNTPRGQLQPSPVHNLAKEDQILVEQLMTSLGRCVIGLQDASVGDNDCGPWRRRLDAARKILDGDGGTW